MTPEEKIPGCMSEVIGKWITVIQDAMPDEMRNSSEWRNLLPLAAGTGRDREAERLSLILAWMWNTVLPQVQHTADVVGFGAEWRTMIEQKTADAAIVAARAAARAAAAHAAASYYPIWCQYEYGTRRGRADHQINDHTSPVLEMGSAFRAWCVAFSDRLAP